MSLDGPHRPPAVGQDTERLARVGNQHPGHPRLQVGRRRLRLLALAYLFHHLIDHVQCLKDRIHQVGRNRALTLARDVAQAYYERRERLGFPMLNEQEVAANG